MRSFLQEVAGQLAENSELLSETTIVFPNRRASLYFQHHLSQTIARPAWAPKLITIEDFFAAHSEMTEPDKLSLIFKLHQVYQQVMKSDEPFDRFYFWGEMLLRDFDEVDKYLVNATLLFKDLSKLKELDESFDYLTEEQKQFLKDFWLHFDERPSVSKEEFLRIWRKLPKVYTLFVKALASEGLAYEGMIHREVAEKVAKGKFLFDFSKPLHFVGFNALTKAEEVLLAHCVEKGAKVHWDVDAYYVNNPLQEAGQFMREYRKHPVLASTFPPSLPDNFATASRQVDLTGVPQQIGQAKLLTGMLEARLKEGSFIEGKTVIVLPDENMLLPVLNSLPADIGDVNVTMGFPLKNTPLYSLLDLMIEMQVKQRNGTLGHRQVTAILNHAYFLSLAGDEAKRLHDEIIANNSVYVNFEKREDVSDFTRTVFRIVVPQQATEYLLLVVATLGASFADKLSFDREYAYHFHQHLTRLHQLLQGASIQDWRGYQKIFRQVVMSQKIPFYGEPLKGLQIMGVLETRNLDFDDVFVLSLNEGKLPAAARQGSYIPHTLRRAYRLPTFDHQDAIYAYLFYRLLQRAEHVQLFYNTEPDVVGNGEVSRYVQQLLVETGWKIKQSVLHNPVHIHQVMPVVIPKSEVAMAGLRRYLNTADSPPVAMLTPSVLNDYIDCPLRFYLRHVAGLREADEVEEDMDARVFGNILHDTLFMFYDELRTKQGPLVTKASFDDVEPTVDRLIEKAFREMYHVPDDQPVSFQGQRVVVREIVKDLALRILHIDLQHAPFSITMLEEKFDVNITVNEKSIRLGGKIDRADQKGNHVRVIDYKTGKDETAFASVESLFAHDQKKRNKAAFQTLMYAYVYRAKHNAANLSIQPGLMNSKDLFNEPFVFGHGLGVGKAKYLLEDATPIIAEFENHLKSLLEELFDEQVPFRQTTREDVCGYCSFRGICHR